MSIAITVELSEKPYIRYVGLPLQSKEGKRYEVEVVANLYQEDGHSVNQTNIRDAKRLDSKVHCRALQHNGSQSPQLAQEKQPPAKSPLNSMKHFYHLETFNHLR